jgi:hypothetical protein
MMESRSIGVLEHWWGEPPELPTVAAKRSILIYRTQLLGHISRRAVGLSWVNGSAHFLGLTH